MDGKTPIHPARRGYALEPRTLYGSPDRLMAALRTLAPPGSEQMAHIEAVGLFVGDVPRPWLVEAALAAPFQPATRAKLCDLCDHIPALVPACRALQVFADKGLPRLLVDALAVRVALHVTARLIAGGDRHTEPILRNILWRWQVRGPLFIGAFLGSEVQLATEGGSHA